MDILEQYKKTDLRSHTVSDTKVSDEYGWLIRFIMRVSGGTIANARQANIALLVIAGAACAGALAIAAANFNILPPPRFSEEESRKQIEEYRQIQPF